MNKRKAIRPASLSYAVRCGGKSKSAQVNNYPVTYLIKAPPTIAILLDMRVHLDLERGGKQTHISYSDCGGHTGLRTTAGAA